MDIVTPASLEDLVNRSGFTIDNRNAAIVHASLFPDRSTTMVVTCKGDTNDFLEKHRELGHKINEVIACNHFGVTNQEAAMNDYRTTWLVIFVDNLGGRHGLLIMNFDFGSPM